MHHRNYIIAQYKIGGYMLAKTIVVYPMCSLRTYLYFFSKVVFTILFYFTIYFVLHIPVLCYVQVFWSRRVRDESSDEIISIREQKKVVNADRLQFTIQELDVDHNYLIQVFVGKSYYK